MYLTRIANEAATHLAMIGAQFTSGHRDLRQQAHAMAVNTAINRQWVGQTYLHGQFIQNWIDGHPEVMTIGDLTEGFYSLLVNSPRGAAISKHLLLPCPVFDILPRHDSVGDEIRELIPCLPGFGKFLEREGGLIRWHCEYDQPVMANI